MCGTNNYCLLCVDDKIMNKAERILDFIKKIAKKENISYEAAEQLAITREFIKYIENDLEVQEWV